jgi:hypothetical protein
MPFDHRIYNSFCFEDFDFRPRKQKTDAPRKRTLFRLKNEGSDKAKRYEELALSTIGPELWNQMKKGSLNWGAIDDEYFRIAEILGEQLERYDQDEVVHLSETVPVLETEQVPPAIPKKQKKEKGQTSQN